MPFGKHKGTQLQHLPKKYVSWLIQQKWVQPELRLALAQRRCFFSPAPAHQHAPIPTRKAPRRAPRESPQDRFYRGEFSYIDSQKPNRNTPSFSQKARQQDSHRRSNL